MRNVATMTTDQLLAVIRQTTCPIARFTVADELTRRILSDERPVAA